MKSKYVSILINFLILQQLSVPCMSFLQDFDFFYFVQQWQGSYCNTNNGCCYPKSGKLAADFGIHGLWPNYKGGSFPSHCKPYSVFQLQEISDLKRSMQKSWPALSCPSSDGNKFWSHEWIKHGTCSESELDQHGYFEAALKLKEKFNLLQILKNAGINPDNGFYSVERIKKAIKEATGHVPGIDCNVDASRHSQLFQVYMCVDTSGSEFIECPVLLRGARCKPTIQFPKF